MNQTILVTGGNGFIGSRVVEQLLAAGYAVAVLDDNSSPSHYATHNQTHTNATFYDADLCDPAAYADINARHDIRCVIHLAAKHYIPFCNAFPEITEHDNIEGTLAVRDYAMQHDIPIVFASSAAVYCNTPNKTAETAQELTLDQADIYSDTKIRGEQLLAAGGLPYAALRFFNVYGAFDPHEHLIPKLVRHALLGSAELQLGSKDSIRDYVYVDDVATAVITVMQELLRTRRSLTSDVATDTGTRVEDLVNTVFDAYAASHPDYQLPTVTYEVQTFKRQNEIKLLESNAAKTSLLKQLHCLPTTPLAEGLRRTLQAEQAAQATLGASER